jgi:hypothetical protein
MLAETLKEKVQREDKLFPNTANGMDATLGESQKILSSLCS